MSGTSDEPSDPVDDPDSVESAPFPSTPSDVVDYYAPESLSVKFYDAITRVDPAAAGDIEFYKSRLGEPGKRVLELGCGTGRVALALAAGGHTVLGVDLAEPMLRRAEAKRRRLPPVEAQNARFLLHDLVTLKLPSRFDAVFVPFYAFNHLSGQAQRLQALKTIARHLKPGGMAAIHACSPERLREMQNFRRPGLVLNFSPSKSRLEVTWNPPDLDEGRRKRTQLIEYSYFAADGSLLEASTERLTYCWFPDNEIARSAHEAGLTLVDTVTGFRGPARERIYVLQKRA